MQTHSIITWKINEHPNKDACIEYIRDNWHDLYCWHEEWPDSLQGFCEHFDLPLIDWEISPCGNSYVTIRASEWNVDHFYGWDQPEMAGVRLWKYLQNNNYLKILNKWHPKYSDRGRIVDLLDGNCPFTGVCSDEVLLDVIREFIARPGADTTMQDLADEAAHRWVCAYLKDWEYAYSDESILDMCEANEYEFDDDGHFYS